MSNSPPSGYTPLALKALSLARTEAERLENNYISAEHIFLGLLALGQGGAANVLQKLGLNLDDVRKEVEQRTRPGRVPAGRDEFRYTPRVKKILKLAAKEAESVSPGKQLVGTEHLLLGILREGDSLSACVLLEEMEMDVELVRQEILHDPGAEK